MRQTIFLAATLAFLWLTNSGHYNGFLLSLGALSIAFVLWLARRMDLVDQEAQPVHLTLKVPFYWLWLGKEIVLANIAVLKHIWLSPQTISPTLAWIPLQAHSEIGRVIYANSITLTPGTVALDVRDNAILIHALTREGLEQLQTGAMEARVSELEK